MLRDQIVSQNEFTGAIGAGLMEGEQGYVFSIQALKPNISLADWVKENQLQIWDSLYIHGAILFRGFVISCANDFSKVIMNTSQAWASYREPATPRTRVRDNIFTSTEYPAEQDIPLHNENSHCTTWPLKLYFYCVTPSSQGGQTPVADCRRILARIPQAVVDEFAQRKWRYIRNFGHGLGFSWQKVFGTPSKEQVEIYCQENAMECVWRSNDSLQVSYVREAIQIHPVTGEKIWFNHGLFFNPISIETSLREMLMESFSENELPYNTYYGDGSRVDSSVLELIRTAYEKETRHFMWQKGDILLIDNMLVAHGRKSFRGERQILVGMADAHPY